MLLKSSRFVATLSFFVILTALILTLRGNIRATLSIQSHLQSEKSKDVVLSEDYTAWERQLISGLLSYGLRDIPPSTAVRYAKVEFTAVQELRDTPLMQDVKTDLPGLIPLDNADDLQVPPLDQHRLRIPVARFPHPPEASNLIFGVATDLERLDESLDGFAHWASNNGARIIAIVAEGPSRSTIKATTDKASEMGIDLKIIPDKMEFNDRYFALIQTLYEHRDDKTEWISLIDDDTFFPSMMSLQALLGKYDASKSHYVGALSEDFFQIAIWGLIAYGGAGIFLSLPLVHEIAPHLDNCAGLDQTGDKRVATCILTYSLVRTSFEPSLHQIDLKGDASGFYEALRPQPVSVHHWKSWNTVHMPSAAIVSKICTDSCIFAKYRFADDWQLTNGVSLVKYSHERGPDDPRMETTWNDSRGEDQEEMFRHSLAPVKPKDPAKISFRMESAVYEVHAGTVRQFYVHRNPEAKFMDIIEVIWKAEQ